MIKAKFIIPVDHSCLTAHFPGNPIAPGVLTLDYVFRCLLEQVPNMEVTKFPQVKFMRPLPPAVEVDVLYIKKSDNLYKFQCDIDGMLAVVGQIQLAYKAGHIG